MAPVVDLLQYCSGLFSMGVQPEQLEHGAVDARRAWAYGTLERYPLMDYRLFWLVHWMGYGLIDDMAVTPFGACIERE
jgi:hypothetical protein